MSSSLSDDIISVCANCGKEGTDITNTCNKCKGVMYCNAACKKKHRHKHKKECERRVAELHDQLLFKQPSPEEDCPICFIRLPSLHTGHKYMSCCGKVICSGCIYVYKGKTSEDALDGLCPFCRTPAFPSVHEDISKMLGKRIELNDALAIHNLAWLYNNGQYGYVSKH